MFSLNWVRSEPSISYRFRIKAGKVCVGVKLSSVACFWESFYCQANMRQTKNVFSQIRETKIYQKILYLAPEASSDNNSDNNKIVFHLFAYFFGHDMTLEQWNIESAKVQLTCNWPIFTKIMILLFIFLIFFFFWKKCFFVVETWSSHAMNDENVEFVCLPFLKFSCNANCAREKRENKDITNVTLELLSQKRSSKGIHWNELVHDKHSFFGLYTLYSLQIFGLIFCLQSDAIHSFLPRKMKTRFQ